MSLRILEMRVLTKMCSKTQDRTPLRIGKVIFVYAAQSALECLSEYMYSFLRYEVVSHQFL